MSLKIFSQRVFAAMPQAVIFDLDNTLYDYAHPHQQAMAAVRAKLRETFNVAGNTFDAAFSQAREEVKRRLGLTASSHSRLLYFQRTIEVLGLKTQVLATLDLEQTYWRTFLSYAQLFDNAVDFLMELRTKGVPLALVTDFTAQIQFRKMVYFGIDRHFDYVVTSEEAGADKEQLAPYRVICEKMNLRREFPVWVIGDVECDTVKSKEVLNAYTFRKGVDGAAYFRPFGADVVFTTYDDLLNELKRHIDAWA